MTTRVLVVDNHDSFVHTLAGYLRELGAAVDLIESDATDAAGFTALLPSYDGVLLSPGPGVPSSAGASLDVVRIAAHAAIPLLGVCLGHQAIAEALGAAVTEAPELMHGMTSTVAHNDSALFAGIKSPFEAGRYHSLAIRESDLPAELRVTARAETGTVMAFEHTTFPMWGVQFHPESVLTTGGYRLLANWLSACGDDNAVRMSETLQPLTP